MKKTVLIVFILVMGLGFQSRAQEMEVMAYQDKVSSLRSQSENAADLFTQLIDGASNSIFIDRENGQPAEYVRPGGVVNILQADSPRQVSRLIKAFPQYRETIEVIDIKWDGRSPIPLSDADLEGMESLKYINLRIAGDGVSQNWRQNIQNNLGRLTNVEVLYRIMGQGQ